MNRTLLLIIVLVIVLHFSLFAGDFTTSGDGLTYTLSDLVFVSGGVVTGAVPNFYLNGNLTIAKKDTLLVDNETLIVQEDPSEDPIGFFIWISGKITSRNNSRFTATSPKLYVAWRGIIFWESDDGSVIENSIIEKGNVGITCNHSNPEIINTTVRNCFNAGIYIFANSSPSITYCNIIDNSGANGILIINSTPVLFNNNNFDSNDTGITSASCPESCSIIQNTFYRNQIGIYSFVDDHTNYYNNTISQNDDGIFTSHNSHSTIENNKIEFNDYSAIGTFDSSTPQIFNNEFKGNSCYVELGSVIIYDSSTPNLGNGDRDGNNTFVSRYGYDLINFTSQVQIAVGNIWSYPSQPDFVIYDNEEDVGDADGSGFISGRVIYNATSVNNWFEFR